MRSSVGYGPSQTVNTDLESTQRLQTRKHYHRARVRVYQNRENTLQLINEESPIPVRFVLASVAQTCFISTEVKSFLRLLKSRVLNFEHHGKLTGIALSANDRMKAAST